MKNVGRNYHASICWPLAVIVVPLSISTATLHLRAGAEESAANVSVSPNSKQNTPLRWDEATRKAFFPNALKTLKGSPPDYFFDTSPPSVGDTAEQVTSDEPTEMVAWSTVVAAEVIEDEIKLCRIRLAEVLKNQSTFMDRGFRLAEAEFQLLVLLFATIDKYDRPIRFSEHAGDATSLWAAAAEACESSDEKAFATAKAAQDELQSLIRGGSITHVESVTAVDHTAVVTFAPLMKRFDSSVREKATPGLSSADEFRRQRDQIQHEAGLYALLGKWLQQDQFGFADEPPFIKLSEQLIGGANGLRTATADSDLDAAQSALWAIRQSCDNCHNDYR